MNQQGCPRNFLNKKPRLSRKAGKKCRRNNQHIRKSENLGQYFRDIAVPLRSLRLRTPMGHLSKCVLNYSLTMVVRKVFKTYDDSKNYARVYFNRKRETSNKTILER